MKTLRELLLERHQSAQPKLDAIRAKLLAAAQEESARSPEASAGRPNHPLARFALLLWQELVFPCRRVWSGVAAAWVFIVALNLFTSEPAQVAQAHPIYSAAEVVAQYQAQQRLWDELLNSGTSSSPESSPALPPPRSERTNSTAMG